MHNKSPISINMSVELRVNNRVISLYIYIYIYVMGISDNENEDDGGNGENLILTPIPSLNLWTKFIGNP